MPLTIHDIARLAGVSATAVSLVLNNKEGRRVSPKTCRIIQAVIARHHYRCQATAQGLTLGKTFQVGLCINGLLSAYPIIGQLGLHKAIGCLAGYLRQAGYGINILQIKQDLSDPRSYGRVARDLLEERVDGYILIKWFSRHAIGVMRRMERRKIPIVALDSKLDNTLTWSKIDHESAFYEGTLSLIGQGFTRIAAFGALPCPSPVDGYLCAMREHRLPSLLQRRKHDFGAAVIRADMKIMLAKHPDTQAVLIDTGEIPMVLDLLTARGIAIMGHGDPEFTALSWRKFPYWRTPLEELCRLSVDLLVARLEQGAVVPPRHVILPCEFCPA